MQTKVIELRQLLAERFTNARRTGVSSRVDVVPSGVATLDGLLDGGLPRGGFTELVAEGHGSGSAQFLHLWLQRVAADGQFLALIDGADSFDATTEAPEVLARLLWVRCRKADEALQAADIILRDRNFPLVALDLRMNPPAQLRKISSAVWHRFKRLLEQSQATVVVVTSQPLVSGASCRVRVEAGLGLEALKESRLDSRLRFTLLRQAGLETGAAQAG